MLLIHIAGIMVCTADLDLGVSSSNLAREGILIGNDIDILVEFTSAIGIRAFNAYSW